MLIITYIIIFSVLTISAYSYKQYRVYGNINATISYSAIIYNTLRIYSYIKLQEVFVDASNFRFIRNLSKKEDKRDYPKEILDLYDEIFRQNEEETNLRNELDWCYSELNKRQGIEKARNKDIEFYENLLESKSKKIMTLKEEVEDLKAKIKNGPVSYTMA